MVEFVARQPILDAFEQVYGYELLHRDGWENHFSNQNADKASISVMLKAFDEIGIGALTGGKKAFINFTDSLIKADVATLFPNSQLIIELLETVVPDAELLRRCRQLKAKGYLLALDDFVFEEYSQPLIELADIIKVDFQASSEFEAKYIVHHFRNGKIRFLAEKVETREQFEKAKSWGYSLFQGYFFNKPVILKVKAIEPYKHSYLQLVHQLHTSDLSLERITEIVSNDVSLSYKLLRLVNAVTYGLHHKIQSVRHALLMLGQQGAKKWITLIAIKGIGEGRLDEAVRLSLVRANFFELLSGELCCCGKSDQVFLMGLFSALDVIMGRPMKEIVQQLSLDDEIFNALLYRKGELGRLLCLMEAYERAEWKEVMRLSEQLALEADSVAAAYLDAVSWARQMEEAVES